MIPCVVLGDSIAVGVGQNRPECDTTARVGITSAAYIQNLLPLAQVNADTAVISLGVNDDPSAATLENLRTVRATLRAKKVYWIVPYSRDYAREAVQQVAQENGDRTLDLRDYSGMIARDRVHPTGAGYQTIAARLGEGVPDYSVSTRYQLQPAVMAVEPEGTWPRTGAVQTDYAETRVSREPGWMREPWARRALARQELAREAWGHTLSHREGLPQVQRPIQVMARTTVSSHGDLHAVSTTHGSVPTPPIPPMVGRIENGHLTVYRTFRDWKSAHNG